MQTEIKCAIEFLLSYLYDKLPRRRVNLFGDELEKYLKLKVISPDTKVALNINFKQNNADQIDPCLIAASKESAMDLKEILECWPQKLKLFIESGLVAYSLDQDLNQSDSDQLKIIYDENTEALCPSPLSISAEAQPSLQAARSPTHSGSLQLDTNQQNLIDLLNKNIDFNNIQHQQLFNQNNSRTFNKSISTNKLLNSQFNSNPNGNTTSYKNNNNNNNNNNSNCNKSRGLNLNFKNLNSSYNVYNSPTSPGSFNNVQLGATSPFQQTDFGVLSSPSSSASTSSSSSHLANPSEDTAVTNKHTNPLASPGPINSNIAILTSATPKTQGSSMFTTAAFAQTKFGSTKSKNNYVRQAKQQKMLPNEFSAYIRNKVKLLNSQPQQQSINAETPNITCLNVDNGFIDYSVLNDQVPLISLSSYSSAISPPPVSQFQTLSGSSFFDKNGLPENQLTSPYTSSNLTDGSQFTQPDFLFNQSTAVNELEENLINNYFSSPFSSSSSSAVSSASSSLSSYNNEKQSEDSSSNQLAMNYLLSANNSLLCQINNLTI